VLLGFLTEAVPVMPVETNRNGHESCSWPFAFAAFQLYGVLFLVAPR